MSMSNRKKNEQLGMPYGTACHRLRKAVLFNLLKNQGLNICFRCGEEIKSIEQLSMEHKVPWLGNNTALFWDLTNIAFSHLTCNSGNHRPRKRIFGRPHGITKYEDEGCRCEVCRGAKRDKNKRRYAPLA